VFRHEEQMSPPVIDLKELITAAGNHNDVQHIITDSESTDDELVIDILFFSFLFITF